MRISWAIGLAAAALASPAAAQDTTPYVLGTCAVVPILPASIPVVEVKIGGKGPYRFAIDTGAQGHGRISSALAEELGLPMVGEVGTPAPGGTLATRPVYGASEISVGGVSFKNLDLVAMSTVRGPLNDWDGILGNELIQLLPLTLDYGNARARFGGPELDEGLRISFDHGTPVLPVDVAGQRFDVHFDSGNGAGALFLEEGAAKALPLSGEPVQRGSARTSFGDFAIMEAPLAVPVTIDGARLSVAAIGWPSPRAGGNLGSRGMAGLTVSIDARSQLATVKPSAGSPRCPT
jgi:hypothetical protein